jgi:hypothetical protein
MNIGTHERNETELRAGLPRGNWGLVLVISVATLMGCDRTESDWGSAKQANTVNAYREFITKHGQGAHVDEARLAIEDLNWRDAKATNTIEAYSAYLMGNKQGRYGAEAKGRLTKLRDESAWMQATKGGGTGDYEQYLQQQPTGIHVQEARQMIDDLSFKAANSVKALEEYLAAFKNGTHVNEARQMIDDLSFKAANSVKALEEYIAAFKNGTHVNEARKTIENLDFLTATKSGTIDAYETYLAKHPDGENASRAKTARDEAAYATAVKVNTIAAYESFLKTHPVDKHAAEVVKKIETLYWNKARTIKDYEDFAQRFPESNNTKLLKIITAKVKTSRQFVVTSIGFGGNAGTMKGNGIGVEVEDHPELSASMTAESAGRLGLIKCEKVGVCDDGRDLLQVAFPRGSARLAILRTSDTKSTILVAEFPESKDIASFFMPGEERVKKETDIFGDTFGRPK